MNPVDAALRRSPPVIDELDWATCLALLATQPVGRLAVARPGAAPHLVPINYALLRGSVVFRTAPGTKLELLVTEPVTFEVRLVPSSVTGRRIVRPSD